MNGLTTDRLSLACRIFLEEAYPAGPETVPPNRRPFLAIPPDQPLAPWLAVRGGCEALSGPGGSLRGYAFRLGSAHFPHLKLQVTGHDNGRACVFTVDTHDAMRVALTGAEAEAWAKLQATNRVLKGRIEHRWEEHGLLTFNELLRRGLAKR